MWKLIWEFPLILLNLIKILRVSLSAMFQSLVKIYVERFHIVLKNYLFHFPHNFNKSQKSFKLKSKNSLLEFTAMSNKNVEKKCIKMLAIIKNGRGLLSTQQQQHKQCSMIFFSSFSTTAHPSKKPPKN